MKRVKSAGKVPISKSAVRQKMQISKTPKLKVKNESRRRITKIKEFSNQLSKVNEASQEESIKSIVDSKEGVEEEKLSDLMVPEVENASQNPVEIATESIVKSEEIVDAPKVIVEEKLIKLDDSFCIQNEIEAKFQQEFIFKDTSMRRHSSLSDCKAKMELMESLLKDDDRDIEEMKSEKHAPAQIQKEKCESERINPEEFSEYKDLPDYSSINDELLSRHNEVAHIASEIKSSGSNSSMDMSSDSSSESKLHDPKEDLEQFEQDESINSDDDNMNLLNEKYDSVKSNLKRKRNINKSETLVLPQLKLDEGTIFDSNKMIDFDRFDNIPIPLKKSYSGVRQSLFNKNNNEENDRLRDEMNKKYIIKKFKEIKSKSYNIAEYQREGQVKEELQGADKKKYVMHVTESELKIIRRNRNLLLDLGATLFWDHKYDCIRNDHSFFHHNEGLNEKKIEFEISGNIIEVEKAKEAIIFLLNYERKIEKEQIVLIEIDMWIPKILIRKVVGYHDKNLIDYYKKFDVSITYDSNLINDESYPIHEETVITIKGKKTYAEVVSSDINEKISKLVVRTVHLAPEDCRYLKEKICLLKCRIDPAEVRICRTTKQQKIINMNHPFFHIPAYYKEVVIIGDKSEVNKAEVEIYKFLREEKANNQNVFTLSILIPFTIQPQEYNDYIDKIKSKCLIDLQTYEAIPPRKHATAMFVGTWDNICLAKDMMVEWIEKQRSMQASRWSDYDKFEKMILNQQIRFTYKSLKRYIIEKHVKYLKHWDLTSHIVVRDLCQDHNSNFDKEKQIFAELAQGETESLQYFMKQVDNETAINVLFATKSTNEFGRLMDKYRLGKREIIEKCYDLLVENMRDYNFMNNASRYRDSSYRFKGLYDDKSVRKIEYNVDIGMVKNQQKVEPQMEMPTHNILPIPSLQLIQPQIHIPMQVQAANQEKQNEESESKSDEKHRSYKHEYSDYRSSREEKHEPRSRHYISSENKHRYSRERRSTHKRSSHRHSSRRSSSKR